jgi:hypothetical protein
VTVTGTDAGKFQTMNDANTPITGGTGPGSFTIQAADNTEDKELSATVAVAMVGQPAMTIKVTQARHVLSLSPASVTPIPVGGGTTPAITVLSSVTGKPWTATVVNDAPEQQATLSTNTGTVGGTFTATFPVLTRPFITPKATVTVTFADYPWLKATLVVNQQSYQPRVVTLQTANSSYGRLNVTGTFYNYFDAVGDFLRDNARFGSAASAIVRTAPGTFGSWPQNAAVSSSSAIFHVNTGINASQRNAVVAWKQANPANVVIVLLDLDHGSQRDLLRAIYNNQGITIDDAGGGTPPMTITRPTTGGSTTGREALWNYLINGPFGTVTPANVTIQARDAVAGWISSNGGETTMVPIILHPSNMRPQLVIDPTKNLVVIGNMDLFSSRGNQYASSNPSNQRFLLNLLAYIVNSAQYGDAFLNQFK